MVQSNLGETHKGLLQQWFEYRNFVFLNAERPASYSYKDLLTSFIRYSWSNVFATDASLASSDSSNPVYLSYDEGLLYFVDLNHSLADTFAYF